MKLKPDFITQNIEDTQFLIAIGGEMRGLSAGVLATCEQNIYIPYANDFRNALNAAGAAAALGFEVLRQRTYEAGIRK